MSKTKFHLSSDDFYRVLLSDVQPYHMPMIFSNEGFYYAVKSNNKFKALSEEIDDNNDLRTFEVATSTVPYVYYINKNSHSLRELSLIHPYQQLKFVDFYNNYHSLILYYCKKSSFSLRYPAKRNSTVYSSRHKKIYEKIINEYKSEHPDLVSDDKIFKYASTFFSYRKYDFNYKFYESTEFVRLERKYPYLRMMDVARCFDSIYTHSISWAVRGKEYIKTNMPAPKNNSSFDEEFDKIMQSSNYQETNGILVGSEVARIFAEVILQEIDENIIKKLAAKNIYNNRDYTIRRYVDDFCIFATNQEQLETISDTIVNELMVYKLFINSSKTKDYIRPFITNRSKNIIDLRRLINQQMSDILEKITSKDESDKATNYYYFPNKRLLKNPTRLSTRFLKDLKSYWHVEKELETGFSSYLLKTLNKQVLMFMEKLDIKQVDEDDFDFIINYFIFIFDLSLYALSLEPKVTQSFSFSRLILIMTRFSKVELEDYHEKFAHRIHTGLTDLLQNELSTNSAYMVERLNILLTLNDIGEYYLPSEEDLKNYIFGVNNSNIDYFSLITGLFIVKRKSNYSSIHSFIIENIKNKLQAFSEVKKSSEAMHLYMDSMSCPYISYDDKKAITKVVVEKFVSLNRQHTIVKEYVDFFSQYYWFVNWSEIDILSKLFRKQLRRAY